MSSELVSVTLPRSFRYRVEDGDRVMTYPAGRTTIPAQMAANLLDAGAINRDSFATAEEWTAAEALRRQAQPAPEPPTAEPQPEATPAPASAPPETQPLPEEIPGYASLRAAGVETLADLADYAETGYTVIDGIGPATAAKISAYLET